ncbi:MAG: hypothetical protein FRX49_08485 [Trebouxia sp. A1-2]|nr:MAG: hypothetical protein FRX49_08485 [Trebouxia sp. A1-2]
MSGFKPQWHGVQQMSRFRFRVASSSDMPPDRKWIPGTAAGTPLSMGRTRQAHAGLHENALQHDIMLIQVAEDVCEHTLGPVGGLDSPTEASLFPVVTLLSSEARMPLPLLEMDFAVSLSSSAYGFDTYGLDFEAPLL